MATSIPDEARQILDAPNLAHVATVMPDGSAQSTPVWIDREDDVVVFNTAKGRAKHRNIEQNPQVAISVVDHNNPYNYVQVRGRAEFVEEGAEAHIDKMAKKYLDEDEYPWRKAGEERIIVRVVPTAVDWRADR